MNENQDSFSDQVFHRLLGFQHYARRQARQLIDERGLTLRDFSVLLYLLENGSAMVGQVQAFVHKSLSTTSTLIAQLEENGYVTRTRSRDDNRVVIVTLTSSGKEIAKNTPLGGLSLLRRRLSMLSDTRLNEMENVLTEIMQMMEVAEDE